jgi:hypothetical protein
MKFGLPDANLLTWPWDLPSNPEPISQDAPIQIHGQVSNADLSATIAIIMDVDSDPSVIYRIQGIWNQLGLLAFH